jgi:hypothetical protein
MTIETTTYTRPDGTPYSERDVAVIERVRADLLSGRTLALHATSARSVSGYHPPMTRVQWAHMMGTLAKMAATSDALAQIARSRP